MFFSFITLASVVALQFIGVMFGFVSVFLTMADIMSFLLTAMSPVISTAHFVVMQRKLVE